MILRGGLTWQSEVPFGRFPPPPPDASIENPLFVYGGYDKTLKCVSTEPEIRTVYLKATFYHLRRLHMNTLVVGPPKKLELDLAAKYGIRLIVRVSGKRKESKELIEHRATLKVMIGDEPKMEEIEDYRQRYANFRSEFDTPIITCSILGGYGTGSGADPLRVWPVLQPKIRMGRLYPFRKKQYDLLFPLGYKGWMSPSSTFQSLENDPSPWWLVPQFFGHERDVPYWRIPTGVELKALMHLAVAHRCTGLLGWSLHDHAGKIFTVFMDGATMAPTKHSQLDALKEFGARLMTAKPFLQKFSTRRLPVLYRSTHEVEAVGRWTINAKPVVYLVNLNTRESRDIELQIDLGRAKAGRANLAAVKSVKEVFTGQSLEYRTEETKSPIYGTIYFSLKGIRPGEARLVIVDGEFPSPPKEIQDALKAEAKAGD